MYILTKEKLIQNKELLELAVKGYIFYQFVYNDIIYYKFGHFTKIDIMSESDKWTDLIETSVLQYFGKASQVKTEFINLEIIYENIINTFNETNFNYFQIILTQLIPDISDDERNELLEFFINEKIINKIDNENINLSVALVHPTEIMILNKEQDLSNYINLANYTPYLKEPDKSLINFTFNNDYTPLPRGLDEGSKAFGVNYYDNRYLINFLFNFQIIDRSKLLEFINKVFPVNFITIIENINKSIEINYYEKQQTGDSSRIQRNQCETYLENANRELNILFYTEKYKEDYSIDEITAWKNEFYDNFTFHIKNLIINTSQICNQHFTDYYKDRIRNKLIENNKNILNQVLSISKKIEKIDDKQLKQNNSLKNLLANSIIFTFSHTVKEKDFYKCYSNELFFLNNLFRNLYSCYYEDVSDIFPDLPYNIKKNIFSYSRAIPGGLKFNSLYFNSYKINYLKEINNFYLKNVKTADQFELLDEINNQFKKLFKTTEVFYNGRNSSNLFNKGVEKLKIDKDTLHPNEHIVTKLPELKFPFRFSFIRNLSCNYLSYLIEYLNFIIALIDYMVSNNFSNKRIKKIITNYFEESDFFQSKILIEIYKLKTEFTFPGNTKVAQRISIYNSVSGAKKLYSNITDLFRKELIVILSCIDNKEPVFSLFYEILNEYIVEYINKLSYGKQKSFINNILKFEDENSAISKIPSIKKYFNELFLSNRDKLSNQANVLMAEAIIKN